MGSLFAESRAALDNEEHLGPETRKTAQWAASMSRWTGDDQRFGDLILPDNPPSRQVENAGFRQRRSYVACVLPLHGGLSSPKGNACLFAIGWPPRLTARAHSPG